MVDVTMAIAEYTTLYRTTSYLPLLPIYTQREWERCERLHTHTPPLGLLSVWKRERTFFSGCIYPCNKYIYDFVAIYVNFGFMSFNFSAVNTGRILNFFYAAASVFSSSLNTTYFAPTTDHHQYQYVSFFKYK